MKKSFVFYISLVALFCLVSCKQAAIDLSKYAISPDTGENSSPLFAQALQSACKGTKAGRKIYIKLPPGRYDFYPEDSAQREYYISNHDQHNPKSVGLPFEGMKNVVFDGQGSELIFHGRMLPISLTGSENCTLKNFSIDFDNPHISQVEILHNDPEAGIITYQVAPWVEYEIRDSVFYAKGHGWEHMPRHGIAFEENTKRLVYRTSDIYVGSTHVEEISPGVIRARQWANDKLIPGTVVAMRGPYRPTPGIFMDRCTDIILESIRVHYAEGMGLLAQASENITLDGLSVCLRGEDDPRYFTTQADATHFSGCKGKIVSRNGLYENMMDDAINVHGTYLKITGAIDDRTVEAQYMHRQCYGFLWGLPGDRVRLIRPNTMENVGGVNRIASIDAADTPDFHGAKVFRITLEEPVEESVGRGGSFGIENLEWTPQVLFSGNIIRNNRARGTLFSTPKKTVVENNVFDHTSGTAILLCGDCNGWYETGACHDVEIRGNRFVNSLTNMFQFTNAVISIYPVIPELERQQEYFHSNIVIENNIFETFDAPLVYAKSVDGIVFGNNTVKHNADYPPFHWNTHPFFFQRVRNYTVEGNDFDNGFDPAKDISVENQ